MNDTLLQNIIRLALIALVFRCEEIPELSLQPCGEEQVLLRNCAVTANVQL